MKAGLVVAVTLVTAGCALNVVKSTPRPNVVFKEPTDKILALKLTPDIQSEFQIPARNGVAGADVREWRETLSNGFQSGFRDYFKISSKENGDMILEISRADIEFAPTAVSAQTGVAAIEAHITYKARLVDGGGKTLKVSASTASSKKSITNRSDVSDCVAGAVESMYEALARDLF
jgi:hypothetical protein